MKFEVGEQKRAVVRFFITQTLARFLHAFFKVFQDFEVEKPLPDTYLVRAR
jgi:hypothetical protein